MSIPFHTLVYISQIVPLSIIFNSKDGVKKYVKKCKPNRRTKPGDEKRQPYF